MTNEREPIHETNTEFEKALASRKILVTGHTGFTGSWMCLWLRSISAEVHGLSLPPITSPSLYEAGKVSEHCETDQMGDIRDGAFVERYVQDLKPELIVHLAAQPLVRESYSNPASTFESNVMGTLHVLEAARKCSSVKGVLCITTDKVYRNKEMIWPYRETDELGGSDPYSASKSCAELICYSWKRSMKSWDRQFELATVRGGNIIGGGDWSADRLIPDFVRARLRNEALTLRYPQAIRPWQHVLCLIHGYMMALAQMVDPHSNLASEVWNLGPRPDECLSVSEVVALMSEVWPGPDGEHEVVREAESIMLTLDSTKARNQLRWYPAWNAREAIRRAAIWYRKFHIEQEQAVQLMQDELSQYRKCLQTQHGVEEI